MSALLKDLPPEISAEQEQILLSLGERETIVLHALRGAFYYMKRLSRGRLQNDELLSATYSALTEAVKTFKPGRGRFSSYARPHLRGRGGLAGIWNAKDCVRGAAKRETPLEKDKYPEPLESQTVQADFAGIHWKELWAQVEPHIRALPKKERQVLELRYKFFMTYQKAGEHMGLSRERVRQIEAAALKKLRAALSNRGEL